jgi:LPS-assembly protein
MGPKRSPMSSDRHLSRPLLPPPPSGRLATAPRFRLRNATLLPLLAAFSAAVLAQAEPEAEPGIKLRLSTSLEVVKSEARDRPVFVRADEIRGRPDLDVEAIGHAEIRRADVRLRADKLSYDVPADLARASGNVRLVREGNLFAGPEAQIQLQSFQGYVLEPTFLIGLTGARGSAARLDFQDADRAVATSASYTSCPADTKDGPAWLLTADSIKLDLETHQGVAEGAVLRFLGVPILAAPTVSFPLSDARKSGWLPPIMGLDSSSGFVAAVPYYWNIAPNRDATITPIMRTNRGPGVDGEFRYLEPSFQGNLGIDLLPWDRDTESTRWAARWSQEATLPADWNLQWRALRVSDNNYWKDFPDAVPSLTRRLLTTEAQLLRPSAGFGLGSDWTVIAAVQAWQALQGSDSSNYMEVPYQRLPQLGIRTDQTFGDGFQGGLEAEFNKFTNPDGVIDSARLTGLRLHAIGSLARPYQTPGWTLTPRLSFNAASYALDEPMSNGSKNGSRIIPTASLDSSWVFERDATSLFGQQAVRQTLEPRVMYVYTPYVNQSMYPLFDTAPKDFNFESIFTENAFSGVDRVSDGNQLTAGLTTRIIDPASGAEAMRLAVVQRVRFAEQRITPEGVPASGRVSDVLIAGSTTLVPQWTLAGSAQYDPDQRELARLIAGARYSPGPFRTINVGYRQARDPATVGLTGQQSNQVELGWQWPIFGPTPLEREADKPGTRSASNGNGSCQGSLYTVGRINYSPKESRVTDAVAGFEYDAGCWIGRLVYQRVSTGLSESTWHLMWQLELVGLSRLGTSPLQVLKDNIPGYRLLRDDKSAPVSLLPTYD